MEVYAPRAALYETLPDFLHRLTGTRAREFSCHAVRRTQLPGGDRLGLCLGRHGIV